MVVLVPPETACSYSMLTLYIFGMREYEVGSGVAWRGGLAKRCIPGIVGRGKHSGARGPKADNRSIMSYSKCAYNGHAVCYMGIVKKHSQAPWQHLMPVMCGATDDFSNFVSEITEKPLFGEKAGPR